MEILTSAYTYEELTGATRLLENMRDNCIKKGTDTYDDPDRKRKYEALNIAIDAIKKLPAKKMAMISQPICGKTIEEIKATREKAVQTLKEMGYEPIDVPFLGEWYNSKASLEQSSVVTVPEYFVAEFFIRITRSNAIYFCKGWKNAVGCWLDHNAASAYGLDIIYEGD